MAEFDASGDGYLQQDEMVSVDQFRNKLEAFSREEKLLAMELKKEAQKEEEMKYFKLELLNRRGKDALPAPCMLRIRDLPKQKISKFVRMLFKMFNDNRASYNALI